MFHTKCSIAASERFTNLTTATKSVYHTNSCPPSFNLPLYFGHIYINSATVCPLPHTDPQHRPESPRSSYLVAAGALPGWTSPCSVTRQHHLPTLPWRCPGEGRHPSPRRRPSPATSEKTCRSSYQAAAQARTWPLTRSTSRRVGEPGLASLEHHLLTSPCQRPEAHLLDVACTPTRRSLTKGPAPRCLPWKVMKKCSAFFFSFVLKLSIWQKFMVWM
jgi:hypothetical protein